MVESFRHYIYIVLLWKKCASQTPTIRLYPSLQCNKDKDIYKAYVATKCGRAACPNSKSTQPVRPIADRGIPYLPSVIFASEILAALA